MAIVNTSVGSADRMQQILCVAFSSTREWDQQNVIITGSTDGVVRMWSMEYVQVPIDEATDEQSTGNEPEVPVDKTTKKVDLIKQMSISTNDGNELQKSGSESSISEACDSVKETSKRFESERDDCSDKEEDAVEAKSTTVNELDVPKCAMSKRGSLTSAKSLHELKHEPSVDKEKKNRCSTHNEINENCAKCKSDVAARTTGADDDETVKGRGIRPSKSDTSLTDSFVVVDNEYNKKKNQNLLRDGE